MRNNIAIISIYPMPFGKAATNRILAYSKGLVENGACVDIFIPYPTDSFTTDKLPDSGEIDLHLNYYYTTGRYPFRNKIIRGLISKLKLRYIIGFITSYRIIKSKLKEKKYSTLIISNDRLSFLFWYGFMAKKINARSIFIFDEFPVPIRHKLKKKIPWWKETMYRTILKNIDAYISISDTLRNYYCRFSKKDTLVLSLIVDTDKFGIKNELKKEDTESRKYLCYMGNMELSKDDVDNIIRAFSYVADEYPLIDLYLYGTPSKKTSKYLQKLVLSYKLDRRIVFKGAVRNDYVPEILVQAHILVSSQPDTVRASGGFPTKLGEYLATGIPSLFTDVGENSKYVKNMEHAFFVQPGDSTAYADKLRFIMNDYQNALSVAKKGQEYIFNNYSTKIQGKKMINFLLKK